MTGLLEVTVVYLVLLEELLVHRIVLTVIQIVHNVIGICIAIVATIRSLLLLFRGLAAFRFAIELLLATQFVQVQIHILIEHARDKLEVLVRFDVVI